MWSFCQPKKHRQSTIPTQQFFIIIFLYFLRGATINHIFSRLLVFAALPEEGPRITGGKARYQIGDPVRLNCTSGRSKPAAHLTWFINGEPADQSLAKSFETIVTGREGLETTILGLEFRVRQRHFKKGDMKLKVSLHFLWVYSRL